jgi:hypothetical protein
MSPSKLEYYSTLYAVKKGLATDADKYSGWLLWRVRKMGISCKGWLSSLPVFAAFQPQRGLESPAHRQA